MNILTVRAAQFAAAVIIIASVIPFSVHADTMSDLQAQVATLAAQLQALKQQKAQAAPSTFENCVVLSYGLGLNDKDSNRGGEVSKLQRFLTSQGASVYPEGKVTGFFGSATMRAVQRWQKAMGLITSGSPNTTGYGYIGPKSRAVIANRCGGQSFLSISSDSAQVQAQDVKIGTGKEATPGSNVSVLYTGKRTDGTVFDSSAAHGNTPLTFQLGSQGIIPGFQVGVNGMKVGGERIVAVPPNLGYGTQDVKDGSGNVTIPANSTLIFDIQLVKVEDGSTTGTAEGDLAAYSAARHASLQQQVQRGLAAIEPSLVDQLVAFVQKIQASARTDIPNLKAFADKIGPKILLVSADLTAARQKDVLSMTTDELEQALQKLTEIQMLKQTILIAYNQLPVDELDTFK